MSTRAGRPQRPQPPPPPPRLNDFQLHYLNQVIPKYQSGPSFTAYDESLEAAYDWLCNFEDALKNDADAALLAKTPGKATAKKAKAAVKQLPVSRPPLFELPSARQNVPVKAKTVAIAGAPAAVATLAPKASKPAAAPAVLSSPVVVVLDTPAPAPSTRSRASSFGEEQTDDDDKVKTGFGGKSRPASLFSQLSLASTAATSASEWEAAQDQEAGTRRESKADVTDKAAKDVPGDDAPPVVPSEDRLSVVEEVVTPPVTSEAATSLPTIAPLAETPAVETPSAIPIPEPITESAPAVAVVEPPSSPIVATIESASDVDASVPEAATVQAPEPAIVKAVEPAVETAPAAPSKPSRPVRSSWLRSALGAEIGAPAGPGAGGARKSQGAALVAAAREREKEREREMAPTPSSAVTAATPAASAGVKRKSDEAQLVEGTVDDEEDNTIRSALQRSTKMLKLDERPLPSSSMLPTAQNSSTTPFKRALFSPPVENEQPEDGMSRVRKAMEELSARTKGRGMSTVGLGTLGGSILGNQSLVGRLTMPAGQTAAGTPTFGSMLKHGLGEDVATPTPEDADSKRLEEKATPIATAATADGMVQEDAEADEVEAVVPRAPSPVVPEVVEAPVAPVEAPPLPASPDVQERSFEIIDLTQSINSLPPTPNRLSVPSPADGQANAPSSFGSLMGDLEHATASPSPPPTPPRAALVTKTVPPAKITAAASISRGSTPPRSVKTASLDNSTTPMASPPKKRVSSNDGDLTLEDLEQSVVVDDEEEVRVLVNAPEDRLAAGVPNMREADGDMEEELIMDVEQPKQQSTAASSREGSLAPGGGKLKQSLTRSIRPESGVRMSTTTGTRLAASSSSQGFSRLVADKIAGKKPKVDDVKSLQAAAEAAKKEQELRERRAAVSKIAEANRLRSAAQKAAEDKAKEEEAKRQKMEEIKERRARAAEVEKRRKEREARDKEKRDQLAAAKAAEEESRKRKLAPSTASGPQPKRQQSTAGPSSVKVPTGKIATKMGMAPSGSAPGKVVPSFNHLPPGPKAGGSSQAGPSTIRLVGSTMGPPVRTSDMGKSIVGPKGGQANRVSQAQSAQVLQAQRQALQSQILSKSQGQQSPRGERPGESEAIELADIDSEYSDSDDEDRPRSGKDAPAWAQSPEIRSALRSQEIHNPDEIFGRMKPLSMEEVFRARAGKFRARTSSANWTHDGVTPQEEMAYGRRMGWTDK